MRTRFPLLPLILSEIASSLTNCLCNAHSPCTNASLFELTIPRCLSSSNHCAGSPSIVQLTRTSVCCSGTASKLLPAYLIRAGIAPYFSVRMSFEQYVFAIEPSVDYEGCCEAARQHSGVRSCDPSEKGHLTILFRDISAKIQITSRDKLNLWMEHEATIETWHTLWDVVSGLLLTRDKNPAQLRLLRLPTEHGDTVELFDRIFDGSVEGQLNLVSELKRVLESQS